MTYESATVLVLYNTLLQGANAHMGNRTKFDQMTTSHHKSSLVYLRHLLGGIMTNIYLTNQRKWLGWWHINTNEM